MAMQVNYHIQIVVKQAKASVGERNTCFDTKSISVHQVCHLPLILPENFYSSNCDSIHIADTYYCKRV